MAITQASLDSGSAKSDAGSLSSQATASVTPSSSKLIVLSVTLANASASSAPPSGVAGAGLTFVKAADNGDATSGLNNSIWVAMGTPSTGAITITPTVNTYGIVWSLSEFAGVETSGSNGANAWRNAASSADTSGTATAGAVTLAAFGNANNGMFSSFGHLGAAPIGTATPDTGATEIHDLGIVILSGAGGLELETQWKASNDTSAACTWSKGGYLHSCAIELVAAGAVTGNGLFFNTRRMSGGFNDMGR